MKVSLHVEIQWIHEAAHYAAIYLSRHGQTKRSRRSCVFYALDIDLGPTLAVWGDASHIHVAQRGLF